MQQMKRLLLLLLSIIVLCNHFPQSNMYASASEKKATTWPKGPSVDAESAILMDLSSGAILYEKKAHKKQYPASITKIMTTLLAIENCSMGEIVTFSHDAIFGIERGSSHIGMQEGEKLTIEQALYGIMLASANEVSWGVGEHISGTIFDFATLMNKRAKELGCLNTNFVNANGLHDDNHYTSAYDMALISKEAMKYSTFRKITASRTYTIPPTNKHDINNAFANHHQMVIGNNYPKYKYEYCIGGKTGYTSNAGSTLVTFAKKNDMELVCVVMKAHGATAEKNQYTDTINLFNWAFENFTQHNMNTQTKELENSGVSLFTRYNPIFNSEQTPLFLNSTSILLPNGVEPEEVQQTVTIYSDVKLKKKENIIGQVAYTYNDRAIGTTNIIFSPPNIEELKTTDPIQEIDTNSIRAIERYDLKPYIIASIFGILTIFILIYVYISKRSRRNRDYDLHF